MLVADRALMGAQQPAFEVRDGAEDVERNAKTQSQCRSPSWRSPVDSQVFWSLPYTQVSVRVPWAKPPEHSAGHVTVSHPAR